MIEVPKYFNLDCVKWGEFFKISTGELRCCKVCHTVVNEKAINGHMIPEVGQRGYRQSSSAVNLVCCGIQVICIKDLTLKEGSNKITTKYKYYCPKCKHGNHGKYDTYYSEIVCTYCNWHFKDMSQ